MRSQTTAEILNIQPLGLPQILDKQAMEAAGAEAEVMHEVNIMKQVEHPNVVNLREIIASRESIFLVMEYVPGGDLFDHVAKHGAMKVPPPPLIGCSSSVVPPCRRAVVKFWV